MFEIFIYLFSIDYVLKYEQPASEPYYLQREAVVEPVPVQPLPSPAQANKPELQGIKHKGLASYYSRAGCLGCSPNFTMANGQTLDDNKLTVAFNRAPLGTMVKITNVKTGSSVVSEVTDRGGFETLKVPKIVDLSVATKEAIGCGGICEVEIEL